MALPDMLISVTASLCLLIFFSLGSLPAEPIACRRTSFWNICADAGRGTAIPRDGFVVAGATATPSDARTWFAARKVSRR